MIDTIQQELVDSIEELYNAYELTDGIPPFDADDKLNSGLWKMISAPFIYPRREGYDEEGDRLWLFRREGYSFNRHHMTEVVIAKNTGPTLCVSWDQGGLVDLEVSNIHCADVYETVYLLRCAVAELTRKPGQKAA